MIRSMGDKIFFQFALLLFLSFNLTSFAFAQDSFYPWSVSKEDPVITGEDSKDNEDVDLKTSPFVSIIWMIDTYKLTSSDTQSCTFQPTCSTYTKKAVAKHGIFMGLIMGAERLMRFHHDPRGYDLFQDREGLRLFDTVEMNDFWF